MSDSEYLSLLSKTIRDIPDFPKPGIVFKDITPLLADVGAFGVAVDALGERIVAHGAQSIVAIESRGFIFGAAVAQARGLPLQLVRKPGKLPYKTLAKDYDLEYGTDRVEIHVDAIEAGRSYAIIDDLIATGGTAAATIALIEEHGGHVCCCAFVIELEALGGRARMGDHPVEVLVRY